MPVTSTDKRVLNAQGMVLRTLAYFDIFDHPLKLDELQRFGAGDGSDPEELLLALIDLETKGLVHRCGKYWGAKECAGSVRLREEAEERARARMPKALVMSRRIARFPFVRAIFLSGSMSKGCLAKDGDIDFFVVTRPGRLWVARTLLILYKKIFLLNSRKDFCVNYFLDTEHLTVEDRNRFTATEVVTLIPTYGNGTTEAFFERNAWAFRMFPGARTPRSHEVATGDTRSKSILEKLLGGRFGDQLDGWCMQLTWYRWKRKFDHFDARTFELALRTRTYVSKHHPRNFQKRVLDGFQERIVALEARLGTPLP
ncbi:MAG: nucleotidyltransferase domain-containing protein [Flavobacteriales bacterium]|nr:nucleotidyltransferase domain-containing protein [Flavobacteriales bacterium]